MMRVSTRVKLLKAFLVASTAILPFSGSPSAFAQEQKVARLAQISYDIPAQPLARSLNAFARASNIKLAYSSMLTQGKQAPAIRGAYSKANALGLLLAGSGLSYRFTGDNAVTISASSQPSTALGADNGTVLETITVKAKGASPGVAELEGETYRGAGTSAYISKENIERFRGTSMGDMLSGVPGVINGENRNGGALDVNIRGMQGQGRTPVVLDGAMQETTVYRGYAGLAGRTYVDPDFIGGISIEKGPSSGPDGTGAIGGVVRARTINAGDIVAPDGTWGLVVKSGLQGNNVSPPPGVTLGGKETTPRSYNDPDLLDLRGFNGSAVAAYRNDMFDFVAGYARRQNGNYFSGSNGVDPKAWSTLNKRFGYDEEILNTAVDNKSYLFRTVFRPDEDHTLDLSYMRYDSTFGEMKPSQLMYGTDIYQTDSEVQADTYTARYRYDPESPLIDLRADLWATNVESLTINPSNYRKSFNQDTFAATLSERMGATVYNTSSFSGEPGDLAVSYGFAYDHEDFGKSKKWASLYSRWPEGSFPGPSGERVAEGWRKQNSIFVNTEYKPAPWITFNAGGRYLKNVVQSDRAGTSWVQGGIKNREEASGLMPSFSVLVEPVQGLQFYTRYAEALRASSPFESTDTGFGGATNPYTNLKPEHAHNTEIGVNYQKYGLFTEDDLFQAKVGWFNNDVTDYILTKSSIVTAANGTSTTIDVRSNIPRVTLRGVEVSARYDVGNIFTSLGATEYTDITSCYDPYSGGRGIACFDGLPVMQSAQWLVDQQPPKRTFTATVGGKFFDEKLTLGARYTHMESNPGYELLDAFGSYRVSDNATLAFAVDNVFDKYYVDALSLGGTAKGGVIPGPGRTFRVSLTSRFGDGHLEEPSAAENRAKMADAADRSAPVLGDFNGNWSGLYVGADWGGTHYSAEGHTKSGNGSASAIAASEGTDRQTNAAIGGLHVGYNHQFDGGLVFGFEVDGSYARARDRQTFIASQLNASYADNRKYQATYDQSYGASASGRVRVGQSFGRTLLYGTGGVGFVQEKQTRTQYRGITPYNTETRAYFSETDTKVRPGVLIGGGLEFAFNDRLSLRSEYLFGYYPEKTFKFDRASQDIYANSGSDVAIGRDASNTLKTHSFKVGLNYKF